MANSFFKVNTGINLKPKSSAPASPVLGDIYYDSTTNTVKQYNGTSWVGMGGVDPVTANRALVSDGSGLVSASAVTSTELGRLSGILSSAVGISDTQTLTNKTIDATSNTISNIVNANISASAAIALSKLAALTTGKALQSNASTGAIEASSVTNTELGRLSGVLSSVVGISDTQTLTNKTLTNPVLDMQTMVGQSSTPSTPAASNFKFYVKNSTNKLTMMDSSGSEYTVGADALTRNYITNGEAIMAGSTTGWNLYNDGASVRPVDGTGGVVDSRVQFSVQDNGLPTSNAKFYFAFAVGNVNAQGYGVSYDFDIQDIDKAKVLNIQYAYRAGTTAFVAGNPSDRTSSGDGSVTVYIYDKTNGVLIPPSTYRMYSSSTTLHDNFLASFQTASNSTAYRLIFHVSTTTALNTALYLDNVAVTPSTYVYGTPITDWQSYTLTIGGTTTAPTPGTVTVNSAKWRRVGDSMEISYQFEQTSAGSAGSGDYLFPIPSGYTVDSSKLSAMNPARTAVGSGKLAAGSSGTGATTPPITVLLGTSNPNAFKLNYIQSSVESSFNMGSSGYALSGTFLSISFKASVPITGWSSSVQMSDSADTRILSGDYGGTPTGTLNTSDNAVTWPTKVADTHSIFNGNSMTIPVSGYYQFSGSAYINGTYTTGNWIRFSLLVDGVTKRLSFDITPAVSVYQTKLSVASIYLNAGQVVSFTMATNAGSPSYSAGTNNFLTFSRISGPSAIAATETISAQYTNTSGPAIPTTATLFGYPNKVWDTHGAYNSGTGFTCPVAGTYNVSAQYLTGSSTVGTFVLQIRVNGTIVGIDSVSRLVATASDVVPKVSMLVKCVAGDVIQTYWNSTVTSQTMNTSTGVNLISIHRVGL